MCERKRENDGGLERRYVSEASQLLEVTRLEVGFFFIVSEIRLRLMYRSRESSVAIYSLDKRISLHLVLLAISSSQPRCDSFGVNSLAK